MSKEVLTHSESYVKKTNRIILVVGLTSFVIFVIGVMLLMQSGPVQEDYTEPVVRRIILSSGWLMTANRR